MYLFGRAGFELGRKHAQELQGITDKKERAEIRKEQILETLSVAAILTITYAVVEVVSWVIVKVVQFLF